MEALSTSTSSSSASSPNDNKLKFLKIKNKQEFKDDIQIWNWWKEWNQNIVFHFVKISPTEEQFKFIIIKKKKKEFFLQD